MAVQFADDILKCNSLHDNWHNDARQDICLGSDRAIALRPFLSATVPTAPRELEQNPKWCTLCDGDHQSTGDSREGWGAFLALAVIMSIFWCFIRWCTDILCITVSWQQDTMKLIEKFGLVRTVSGHMTHHAITTITSHPFLICQRT